MHYASKTASASRGVPTIRLNLRNPSGFSVPAQFLVLIQNPAGGGSRQFNRFLAELATGQICRSCWKLRCKKNTVSFRMPHGFDFATQNLGAREEFSHLIRKPPPLRKTVGFPNPCGNFSTKSRPTTPKVKVVRPEQIRLLLERATRFAGGGSQPFNRFHAELTARADLFAAKAAHGLVRG